MTNSAETHHYIKNILQAIISYTNTAVISNKQASPDGIKKLHCFIQILSGVQDLVFAVEPINYKGNIRADRVIEKAVGLASDSDSITHNEFPEMLCPVKRATNLALICLETLFCLKKQAGGAIEVEIIEKSSNVFSFKFDSKNSPENPGAALDSLKADLKLAALLLKSDLGGIFEFNTDGEISISGEFNLNS